ncbi:DUF2927 domain-containing protein [Flavobacteriaceae bacterium]|nr:DUF2927 domain-containing protein [Flavobacteriaceae bacterium]
MFTNGKSKNSNLFFFYLFLRLSAFSILSLLFIKLKEENALYLQDLERLKTSNHILNSYSEEAIKHFYNTIYYSETEKSKQLIIKRWEEDLKIYAHGNLSEKYINDLKVNAEKIASLKLGVNVFIVNDPSQANIDVYFGSKRNLDTPFNSSLNYSGIGELNYKDGRIDKAKIGVVITNTPTLKVKYILLEEMIQIMGLIGDNFTYKESLFYEEGYNKYNDLTHLDKEVLKLLYDPNISPQLLTLKNYEYLFGHLLPNVNTTEKVLTYWKKVNPSKSVLQKIRTSCFDKDSLFRKFSQPIRVKINGNITQKDSLDVAKAIFSLNTIEGLTLQLKEAKEKHYEIQLKFKQVSSQERKGQWTLTRHFDTNNVMTPTLIKADIELNINPHEENKNRIPLILSALYQAIGPYKEEAFEGDLENNQTQIPLEYQELIKIIYHKSFASGLSLEELDHIIQLYKKG